MYFSLGAHPALKCPMSEGEAYSDCYLEFEKAEDAQSLMINTDGLVQEEKQDIAWKKNILPLEHALFEKDALMFNNLESKKVSLCSRKSTERITFEFSDFNDLGLWAKTNGDFLCIEPWNGINDYHNTNGDITQKEGIIALSSKESYKAAYTIQIDR